MVQAWLDMVPETLGPTIALVKIPEHRLLGPTADGQGPGRLQVQALTENQGQENSVYITLKRFNF